VKFVEEFRKLTKDQSILLLRFVHEIPDDPRSDSTLMIGVYQMDDEKERISLLNKVLTALNLSKDQSIKKIELRAHNRNNDEVQRLVITREKIEGYRDGSLSDTDFMSAFEMLTPSPSPEPTATPTPESGTAAGGYGMGMGMYGMMGMGGMGAMGGAGGAAPAGQAAPAGDEAIGP
ncbi:MAG: hypothetical protein RBU29_08650, partial [bacterium]|nr:hypothetical protein [bacterium]